VGWAVLIGWAGVSRPILMHIGIFPCVTMTWSNVCASGRAGGRALFLDETSAVPATHAADCVECARSAGVHGNFFFTWVRLAPHRRQDSTTGHGQYVYSHPSYRQQV
jgi:hypothetical protein